MKKEFEKEVFEMLKNRNINPGGAFDKAGRFYLNNGDLVNVRSPSRSWPYSQMAAGRTLKFVKKISEKFNCQTKEELINKIIN